MNYQNTINGLLFEMLFSLELDVITHIDLIKHWGARQEIFHEQYNQLENINGTYKMSGKKGYFKKQDVTDTDMAKEFFKEFEVQPDIQAVILDSIKQQGD